jgi:hypothetical protein
MRTKLSTCARKIRFNSEAAALVAAQRATFPLRAYRCERCGLFHLTGRLKGKCMPLSRAPQIEGGGA